MTVEGVELGVQLVPPVVVVKKPFAPVAVATAEQSLALEHAIEDSDADVTT